MESKWETQWPMLKLRTWCWRLAFLGETIHLQSITNSIFSFQKDKITDIKETFQITLPLGHLTSKFQGSKWRDKELGNSSLQSNHQKTKSRETALSYNEAGGDYTFSSLLRTWARHGQLEPKTKTLGGTLMCQMNKPPYTPEKKMQSRSFPPWHLSLLLRRTVSHILIS